MKLSTLRLGAMVGVLYIILLPAALEPVAVTLVVPGPIWLAGRMAGFLGVCLLLRAWLPGVQEEIRSFMSSIEIDE